MVTDVMIDIEALALHPDALVLSIGAVKFDPDAGVIQDTFYVNVRQDLQEGRVVAQDTLKWWAEQSVEARGAFLSPPPITPKAALHKLNNFTQDARYVWANPPSYDMVVLRSLYKENDVTPAWNFRQEVDYKTIRNICAVRGIEVDFAQAPVAHNALDDAGAQAINLHRMFEALKHGK